MNKYNGTQFMAKLSDITGTDEEEEEEEREYCDTMLNV